MKKLVLVDFDKTLYKKDSLIEFTKFYQGNRSFYFGIIRLLPYLIQWKLGIITNEKAKIKYITYFFKEEDYNLFLERGTKFAQTSISRNLDKKISSSVKKHLSKKDTVFIITASCSEWISGWANDLNIKIISTKLEIENSKLTGKLSSKNCYGIEKVNRIKAEINLDDFETIKVYGNGKGDFEMLQLVK